MTVGTAALLSGLGPVVGWVLGRSGLSKRFRPLCPFPAQQPDTQALTAPVSRRSTTVSGMTRYQRVTGLSLGWVRAPGLALAASSDQMTLVGEAVTSEWALPPCVPRELLPAIWSGSAAPRVPVCGVGSGETTGS